MGALEISGERLPSTIRSTLEPCSKQRTRCSVRCPQRIPLRKITSHALSAEDSGRYSRVAVFPQLLSLSGLSANLQFVHAGITEAGTMAETYVPLISSGIAGPLGVLHLPRLWQKVSLEESGKLASGYPGVGKGFDAMTLAALGLEEQAVRDYIRQSKPTYPQFEAVGKEKREIVKSGRRREAQRGGARLQSRRRNA